MAYHRPQNEQGMVHAAIAYAKMKNRLQTFACTSSIGPGATNMITGAATATVNRLPVLLLPGDIFASRRPDPVLQQLEYPLSMDVSVNDAFIPVSRYWDRINRPEQILASLPEAMRVLTDQAETGAVTICLPQDVQAEAYDYPENFFEKRVYHIPRVVPPLEDLQRAAEMIRNAERPLIVAGGGVIYSEATAALSDFADALGIPVTRDAGGEGRAALEPRLERGTDRLQRRAGGEPAGARGRPRHRRRHPTFRLHLRLAHPVPEPGRALRRHQRLVAGRLQVRRTAARRRCAGHARRRWARSWPSRGYRTGGRLRRPGGDAEGRVGRARWTASVPSRTRRNLTQANVIGMVNAASGPRDVVVCAAGGMPGDLLKLWRPVDPKGYHLEYGYSCMGYEIAGGLGAKMADPSREIYVMVGDGSYLMLHTEIVTSLEEGQKLTIVVVDNGGFQCIRNLQMATGSPPYGNELRYRDPQTGHPRRAVHPDRLRRQRRQPGGGRHARHERSRAARCAGAGQGGDAHRRHPRPGAEARPRAGVRFLVGRAGGRSLRRCRR